MLIFLDVFSVRFDRHYLSSGIKDTLTFNGHIETAEQRTIMIQQYGDWYTGR